MSLLVFTDRHIPQNVCYFLHSLHTKYVGLSYSSKRQAHVKFVKSYVTVEAEIIIAFRANLKDSIFFWEQFHQGPFDKLTY